MPNGMLLEGDTGVYGIAVSRFLRYFSNLNRDILVFANFSCGIGDHPMGDSRKYSYHTTGGILEF